MGKYWTHAEDEVLRAHYKKTPVAQICTMISRTPKAIFQRAMFLGLGRRHDDDELPKIIRGMCDAGLRDEEISHRMDVCLSTVQRIRRQLGLAPNTFSSDDAWLERVRPLVKAMAEKIDSEVP